MPINTLRQLLVEVLGNYQEAVRKPFTGHPLARLIRNRSKEIIQPLLVGPSLFIKGSVGQGNWVKVPWIAVINKDETDGAQEGIYIVYIFSQDMKRVYLTFNQGVNRPKKKYGRKLAIKKLKAKAIDIQANFPLQGFLSGDGVELASAGLGSDYEKAVIYYKKYFTKNLPDNEVLENDLKVLVSFYNNYLLESNVLTEGVDFSVYTGKVEEGKRLLKQHYVRERNPGIVRMAKEEVLKKDKELRCLACDFSFREHYGERGENFIEAHHKKPVSEMKAGDKTSSDDIVFVCSNCHRMIHRKMPWLSIKELKVICIKGAHK